MSITRNKATRTQYLSSLRNKVQQMTAPKGFQKENDDRYWKPEVDKAGTGSAIIRFLPAKEGEEFPFVQLHTHGFQGPSGKWLIDNCPSSLGGLPSEVCPVCASNIELYNASKDKEDPRKKTASARKRKLSYISNILVVNDPKHPENNGKVFLYKYGKKIFEKIKDMIDPPEEFADMVPVDPFDMYEGANFKLRITRQDNFPNYDKSSFDNPSAIGDEDAIAQVESTLYALNEILDPKHFKSFADLKKRFDSVVGDEGNTTTEAAKPSLEGDGAEADNDMPVAKPKTAPKASTAAKTAAPKAAAKTTKTTSTEAPADDNDEDYFSKLAQQADEE